MFCWVFGKQGSVLKSVFSTNIQSRFVSVVFDKALGPLRLVRHTLQYPCIFQVLEAMDKDDVEGP